MNWIAQAPSNIALIKYMGKLDNGRNLPTNPSISYTLDDLYTSVSLEQSDANHDEWQPFTEDTHHFVLSATAQSRFLSHLDFLKRTFHYSGFFIVRSRNNFPMCSGLASSASSFAALTRVACMALSELTNVLLPSQDKMSEWSREGSGSSCRSFFKPWSMWDKKGARAVEFPYTNLIHDCLIISREHKVVSSSEAHLRVVSSPRFAGRAERATNRLNDLLNAFKRQDWHSAFDISWEEFQDMHELFVTADDSFEYLTDESRKALKILETHWQKNGDGPIVTMDAGPNIHLLYRQDQKELSEELRRNYFSDY